MLPQRSSTQRCPMTKQDGNAPSAALFVREPRKHASRRVFGPFAALEVQAPRWTAEANPRQDVDDHPRPLPTPQVLVERLWTLAVQAREELCRLVATQEGLGFLRPSQCVRQCPAGQNAGVNHQHALIAVGQWQLPQPRHELGVFHFRQLVGLEGYDFNWLAAKLGFSPERLRDLGWAEQAAELAEADRAEFEAQPGVEPPGDS